ncbi:MAG: PA14 domain-containing protein [Verrucomicrobiota bacterium]
MKNPDKGTTDAVHRRAWNLLLLTAGLAAWTMVEAKGAAPAAPQNLITGRGFLNITGTAITDLTTSPKFPGQPDVIYYFPYFEWNADSSGDIGVPANNGYGDNYGAQVLGYFYPPATGEYVFFLGADDHAELYLSTDATSENKKLIASETSWSNPREFTVSSGSSDLASKNSSQFKTSQWPTTNTAGGAKITLTKGQAYYIEGLFKEGTGGDNLAVAAQAPDGSIDSTLPIPGSYLATFDLATVTGPIKIVTQPQSQTVDQEKPVTFSVNVSGAPPYSYQWRKNGADIPQARNASSYTIAAASSADNGAKFSVIVTGGEGTITSADAVLTVKPITTTFKPGWAKYERWSFSADAGTVDDFRTALESNALRAPDVSTRVAQFGAPWGVADNYWAKVSGYFIPPTTGSYVFFVGSDDNAVVYLSSDDTAAKKKMIARESSWSNQYQFTTSSGSSTLENKRSDTFDASEWTPANAITLQAGTKYYLEVLLDEGTGGDGADVTYKLAGQDDPSNDAAGMKMTGSVIGSDLNVTGAEVTITTQPQSTTVAESLTATFTAAATGTSLYNTTVAFQWQKAPKGSTTFVDIPGARTATYTTPGAVLSDDGAQFRVVASVPAASANSQAATLTVSSDKVPPTVLSAGALKGASSVGLAFNEGVESNSAANIANYTVTGATVTDALIHMGKYVELKLAGPIGASFSVTIKNVKDVPGNAMSSQTVTGQISNLVSADVGDPGVDPVQPGSGLFLGDKTYFVTGGGHDIWDTADGFQFLYMEFTGTFDMRARVTMNPRGPSTTTTWAKAELMARESTAAGSRHNSVAATRADGENAIEGQWRDATAQGCGNARVLTPIPYPNNWIRLVRPDATKGDISIYTSTDGVTWTFENIHATPATDPDPAFPATLLVGMAVTSHDNSGNDILAEGLYEEFTVTPYQEQVDPQLKVSVQANQVVITWAAGTLLSSPTVNGPYTTVTGATSPYRVSPSGTALFLQIKQ